MTKQDEKIKELKQEIKRLKRENELLKFLYAKVLESDTALREENGRLQKLEHERNG